MHQAEPYGHLLINGIKPDAKTISRLVKVNIKTYNLGIAELMKFGVLKKTKDGVVYCSRMVKDQEVRERATKNGVKGGNPLLVNRGG